MTLTECLNPHIFTSDILTTQTGHLVTFNGANSGVSKLFSTAALIARYLVSPSCKSLVSVVCGRVELRSL